MIEIDFESLRAIGLTSYIAQQLLMLETVTENASAARVIEIHRDEIIAHNGHTQLRARRLPAFDISLAVQRF